MGNFQTAKLSDKELHLIKGSIFSTFDLLKIPTNAQKSRYYNQMAFHLRERTIQTTKNGGAFDFFESVFRSEDEKAYSEIMQKLPRRNWKGEYLSTKSSKVFYEKFWRTAQMSDNLPLWIELKVANALT